MGRKRISASLYTMNVLMLLITPLLAKEVALLLCQTTFMVLFYPFEFSLLCYSSFSILCIGDSEIMFLSTFAPSYSCPKQFHLLPRLNLTSSCLWYPILISTLTHVFLISEHYFNCFLILFPYVLQSKVQSQSILWGNTVTNW